MDVEDARGFAYKRDLYKRYNLLGFSAFTLGLEDPRIWQILK
jgi:spore germination protein YaaH